ncbi:hypothetical protein DIPPA_51862 [Diplonema papillatum]|nr:hypothetical protein DIPPA_51862 [Diplonema papillatum]
MGRDTMLKTLHVFDFDGTLFRSPVPNPELYTTQEIGTLKGNGGWFHLPATLNPPVVPVEPGEEFWIPSARQAAEKALSDLDSDAILLTGRSTLYRNRIIEITKSAQLHFPQYFLKPAGETTVKWKKEVITQLVEAKPYERILIYEDRHRHVTEFRRFLAENFLEITEKTVIHVTEPEIYLPVDVEAEVVMRLKQDMWQYQLEKLAATASMVEAVLRVPTCDSQGALKRIRSLGLECVSSERRIGVVCISIRRPSGKSRTKPPTASKTADSSDASADVDKLIAMMGKLGVKTKVPQD